LEAPGCEATEVQHKEHILRQGPKPDSALSDENCKFKKEFEKPAIKYTS
jgi:hypothetical protein